jgi:hypothetical protein
MSRVHPAGRTVVLSSIWINKKPEQSALLRNLCREGLHYGARGLLLPSAGADGMTDKAYLVRFKPPDTSTQLVVAESTQIYGEHLVFLNSKGELAALFLLEIVEGWSELSD